MPILNLRAGYFSIDNPFRFFDRWLNGPGHERIVHIQGKPLELRWSQRAESQLECSEPPLVVELQLYFSCVVKKRVLFHRQVDFATTRVDDRLQIAFRPMASAVCDPIEFSRNHPAGRNLSSGPAGRMLPSAAEIDYRAGRWVGQFYYR